MWRYADSKSPTAVERQFRQEYVRNPSSKSCIMKRVKSFQETCLGVDEQVRVKKLQAVFQRNQKSIRRASRELQVPKSTIDKVLHKRLYHHKALHKSCLTTLSTRIVEAVQTADVKMLQRAWREMGYRLDIERWTRVAHVEIMP